MTGPATSFIRTARTARRYAERRLLLRKSNRTMRSGTMMTRVTKPGSTRMGPKIVPHSSQHYPTITDGPSGLFRIERSCNPARLCDDHPFAVQVHQVVRAVSYTHLTL